jgi:hypothetical protein
MLLLYELPPKQNFQNEFEQTSPAFTCDPPHNQPKVITRTKSPYFWRMWHCTILWLRRLERSVQRDIFTILSFTIFSTFANFVRNFWENARNRGNSSNTDLHSILKIIFSLSFEDWKLGICEQMRLKFSLIIWERPRLQTKRPAFLFGNAVFHQVCGRFVRTQEFTPSMSHQSSRSHLYGWLRAFKSFSINGKPFFLWQ